MNTDLCGRFRAWLTASLVAWAIWTFTVWAIGYFPLQLSTFWQNIDDAVTRAILVASMSCILLLGLLWGLPKYLSMIRRWGHRQECLAIDFAASTFGVFAGLTWWFGFLNSWKSNVFGVVCVAALGTLFARIFVAQALRPYGPITEDIAAKSVDFFDTVLGRIGLAPLFDFSAEDKLGRETFVATLVELVFRPREQSITVGLNGPWGTGKTTILKEVGRRLRARGAVVAQFDSWNFREPDRLVHAYLSHVESAVRVWAYLD